MFALVAQSAEFVRPHIDWHAVAPELVLLAAGALVTVIDLIGLERTRRYIPTLTGLSFLAAMVPIFTLWDAGDLPRVMWDGAYVTGQYALVLKALFLLSGYVVVLLATNYLAEGDYYDSEFYQLISASVLGMVVMTSARDLVTIFVAIELVSIPAYLMAAWRKRDLESNEAGLKYMLMGIFASAIMLYGMSLLYGVSGTTTLSGIGDALSGGERAPLIVLGIVFVILGLGFKVSAVPFHTWAPDTYEGAPTPLTAFLAVASKAAGFVAIMNVVLIAFAGEAEVVEPLMFVLAALTMTVGNLIAMRQTNVVRMLAYSGIAQAGYMLAPLAVYGSVPDLATSAIVTYLLVYAAMNLGAFAVVLAAARKTGSGELSSFGGMLGYAPGLTLAMTVFLFSLAGVPPAGGWWGKFEVFRALTSADTTAGYVLALLAAVNSVVAAFYYLRVMKAMWFMPTPDGDESPVAVPATLSAALIITVVATLVLGTVGIGWLSDLANVGELALN